MMRLTRITPPGALMEHSCFSLFNVQICKYLLAKVSILRLTWSLHDNKAIFCSQSTRVSRQTWMSK